MSSLSTSVALRRHRFSFTEGLASAFDWAPITYNYHVSATPQIADATAIASDFIVTGDDLRLALSEYGRTR
jgi:hypothetical protein